MDPDLLSIANLTDFEASASIPRMEGFTIAQISKGMPIPPMQPVLIPISVAPAAPLGSSQMPVSQPAQKNQ